MGYEIAVWQCLNLLNNPVNLLNSVAARHLFAGAKQTRLYG